MTAKRILLALLLGVSASGPLSAADKDVFAYAIRPEVVFEGYVGRIMAPARSFLRRMPKGSAALPAFELGLYDRASERRWGRAVNAAMRADTDGNDRLDRSELSQAGVQAEKIDELFRLFGKNEDAAISRHELNTVSEPSVVAIHAYLKLADGDKVRPRDIMDRAIRTFRKVDTDGNLEISAAEYRSAFGDAGADANQPSPTRDTVTRLLINLVRDSSEMTLPPGSLDCAMPRPSSKAEIVLLGVHGGAAVSNVYVGSSDKQTTTAEINVKAGREPLYIILSAIEPIVWRFSGATNRIERVVLSGPERRHSGAVGISARRLALADGDERDVCVPQFHDLAPEEGRSIGDRVAAAIGRRPDRMAATDSVAKLLVTSMAFVDAPVNQPVPPGFDQQEWRAALQLAPAGLVNIDPGKVAAFTPAARYDVLPIKRHIAEFFGSGPPQWLPRSGPAGTAKPKLYVPEDSGNAPRGKFGIRLGVQAP
ncbi:MAG: calpain-6 [Proteobacteria bacterium]|nr:calpain-6 [Pseudomonadota bacterium]